MKDQLELECELGLEFELELEWPDYAKALSDFAVNFNFKLFFFLVIHNLVEPVHSLVVLLE